MAVVETHLREGLDISERVHSRYNWEETNRRDGTAWGGTGVFIERRIQYENISDMFIETGVEVTVLRFTFRSFTVCFCAIYLPQSDRREISRFLDFLDKVLLQEADILLICGDFNAWHVAWGDRTNRRGEVLYEGVVSKGLNIERCSGITRIGNRVQRDSYVDLIISNCGGRIPDLINSFQISDHVIINGTIRVDVEKGEDRIRRWDFRNTYLRRGGMLRDYFESLDWCQIIGGKLMEDIPDIMNKTILRAWESYGIYKWVNTKSKPWFTQKVKEMRREARYWERQIGKFKKAGKYIVIEGKIFSLKECKVRHMEAIREWREEVAKLRTSSEKYINNLMSQGVFQTIRRIYKCKHRTIPALRIRRDGEILRVTSDRSKAMEFQQKFLHNSTLPTDFQENDEYVEACARRCNIELKNFELVGERVRRIDDVPARVSVRDLKHISSMASRETEFKPCESYFSLEEIKEVRRTLKKEKGGIGINNDHIRKIESDNLDRGLQLMANIYWHYSFLPMKICTSIIDPLLKGGEGRNPSNLDDYRGISKSDQIGRAVYERLLYNRLRSVVLDRIKSYQAGGMPGRGTIPQLIALIDSITQYRNEEDVNRRGNIKPCNYVILVLLDCSKAFDIFNRVVCLDRLREYGVRGRLFENITAFFEKRFQRVRIGKFLTEIARTFRGGPQGSVITMLCFLIVINNVGEGLVGGEKDLNLFMDDVAFIEYGKDAREVTQALNNRLTGVLEWSHRNGVSFPFKKFHLINLGRKKLTKRWKDKIRYGEENPPWSTKAKYLGVIVDHHLHFRDHMSQIIEKVEKVLYMLRKHRHFEHGGSPKTLHDIFQYYIYPQYIYGTPLWIFGIRKKFRYNEPITFGYGKLWGRLKSIYRGCARDILGLHKNASGEAALVRLGWMPLDYKLALLGLKYYVKCWLGRCGETVRRRLREELAHINGKYSFYKRAHEFLMYLEHLSGFHLLTAETLKDDGKLKEAMYTDLTKCWREYRGARVTRDLYNTWNSKNAELGMNTRLGRSLVNGAVCGYSILRTNRLSNRGGSDLCRGGCRVSETLEHVLLECPCYSKQRVLLHKTCRKCGVSLTVRNALTHSRLLPHTESLFLGVYRHVTVPRALT